MYADVKFVCSSLIAMIISKYWQGHVRLFVKEDLNIGFMAGSCIMTTLQLMKLVVVYSVFTYGICSVPHTPVWFCGDCEWFRATITLDITFTMLRLWPTPTA